MTETADVSPVARLRAAADLLERLDCDATPGQWTGKPCAIGTTTLHAGPNEDVIGDLEDADDAALIAVMRSLAPLLPVGLREMAERLDEEGCGSWLSEEARTVHVQTLASGYYSHAIALADAVLADAKETGEATA
jgi:hypothetical protein